MSTAQPPTTSDPRSLSGPAEILALAGTTVGHSPWLEIHQERIDEFANATGDHQWIHVDPEMARQGPYGATIAHGYLTLSLIPLLFGRTVRIQGVSRSVNYGLNKVRFINPVRVGSQVRDVVDLVDTLTMEDALQMTWGR